ncbi:MAG: hypothetical protein LQ340_000503 [Diploschistes diacapsis]|nr:MAG: hypothetical protein LQ340_000503 [Diploschistes diacapsis]
MLRLPPTKIELNARDLEWHTGSLERRKALNLPASKSSQRKSLFAFEFPGDQDGTRPHSAPTLGSRSPLAIGEGGEQVEELFEEGSGASSGPFTTPLPPIESHSRLLAEQTALLKDLERCRIDPEGGRNNTETAQAAHMPALPGPASPNPSNYVSPPSEPRLPGPFSATPRNVSWNYSLPNSPPVQRYSGSSTRFRSSYGLGSSPARSRNEIAQPGDSSPGPSMPQSSSSPPTAQAPRIPAQSDFRIYDDALPAESQPQTPLGLPRRGLAPMHRAEMYTAPRPFPTTGRETGESIHATPTRTRSGRSQARSSRDAAPVDGTVDQENAGRYAEWERMRRIIRDQRLGYGTGNTEELDRTPPREPRRRPWE